MASVKHWWIKLVQERANQSPNYEEDPLRLNPQTNEDGLLEFRGRIQGRYPIYLSDDEIYSDNGGTFVKSAKWLRSIRQDEKLQGYVLGKGRNPLAVQFVSRTVVMGGGGGQFERLIGIVKRV